MTLETSSLDFVEDLLSDYEDATEVALGEPGFLVVYRNGEIHYKERVIGTSVQVFRAIDTIRLYLVLGAEIPYEPGFAYLYADDEDGLTAELLFSPAPGEEIAPGLPSTESYRRLVISAVDASWWAGDGADPEELSDEELLLALETWALITQN